jgi:LysM repeat protein
MGGAGAAQAGAAPLSRAALATSDANRTSVNPTSVTPTLNPASAKASAVNRTYTVQPGDTLTELAQRFGTTVAALAGTNGIADINVIDVDQVLTIPTGAVSTTAVPARREVSTSAGSHSQGRASLSGIWACIAARESGGNPAAASGNGYYGMFQFSPASWAAAGGQGNPANASASEQLAVAQRLQAMSGWGNWPVSSRECGA